MFVAIDNKDMNALDVDAWINRRRNENGGVISPNLAMEILGKTNHYSNIKKVLRNMKKHCADENGVWDESKLLPYKDFILSCVDEREISDDLRKTLYELAKLCKCEKEFELADDEVKYYKNTDCEGNLRSIRRDYEKREGEGFETIINDCEEYMIGYRYIDSKNVKFRVGTAISFNGASNLPEVLDLTNFSRVNLWGGDFSGVKEIKFRKNAEVRCYEAFIYSGTYVARNLPEVLDFSMCSHVCLTSCNLSSVKEIKFKEGGNVSLDRAQNLPPDLDVSMCRHVGLRKCDLSSVKELKFKEGATVFLDKACNLPRVLDLSMCDEVSLYECDLSKVRKLKFKNEYQKSEFMSWEKFKGRIIYTEKNSSWGEKFRSFFDKDRE